MYSKLPSTVGECKQRQQDGDDDVVRISISKVEHLGNFACEYRCYKHWLHLSSSNFSPVECNSLIQDVVLETGLCSQQSLISHWFASLCPIFSIFFSCYWTLATTSLKPGWPSMALYSDSLPPWGGPGQAEGLLKMAHSLRAHPGMLFGPAALQGLMFLRTEKI